MNSTTKHPNFFILGAPKCGTTSMAEWLSAHPHIFMSARKEPHYFNKDHKHNTVVDFKGYLSLFVKATNEHVAVGEASVWYLFSKVAVNEIVDKFGNENLKFIVMLREPSKMAYSLHEQQVFNLNEPEKDFLKAWNLQDERKANKKIGISTRDSQLLVYGEACKVGEQVKRLLEIIPKESVKIILLEDIKQDSLEVYKDVLQFLEAPYDGRNDFTAVNTAKIRKSESFAMFVKLIGKLKLKIGIKKGLGLLNNTNQINVTPRKRDPLDPETEKMLKAYFKDDVLLLSKIIERDLSHWVDE